MARTHGRPRRRVQVRIAHHGQHPHHEARKQATRDRRAAAHAAAVKAEVRAQIERGAEPSLTRAVRAVDGQNG